MNPAILLCNYTDAEQNAWRFLLRKLPGIRLIPVKEDRYGLTLKQLLEETGPTCPGTGIPDHLAVFCGAEGLLLSQLIDLSGQVFHGKGYKATLTKTNEGWTLPELYRELQAEEAQIKMRMKK